MINCTGNIFYIGRNIKMIEFKKKDNRASLEEAIIRETRNLTRAREETGCAHVIIPTAIGHDPKLRFHMVPVNEKIMNADKDWPDNEEFSSDNTAAIHLFYPFIKKFYSGTFIKDNEINLMSFEEAGVIAEELKKISDMLEHDYENPALERYKAGFSIELMVSDEEYLSFFSAASPQIVEAGIRTHIDVVIGYYRAIAAYLEAQLILYADSDYHQFAFYAPH